MQNLINVENSNHVEEYKKMSSYIQKHLPTIVEATGNFCKTQSQFMDNFLTISHPTPLRNAHQILAELTSSISALQEAQYNTKKAEIKIKMLERDKSKLTDELEIENISLDIDYEIAKLQTTKQYVDGAVRKVTNYIEQYNNILENNNIEKITEELFEKEEEKYHIMRAFNQALCAARSRGGCIDEGNFIYFSQIGINGAMAQSFVSTFLNEEQSILSNGNKIDGTFQISFLKNMAKLFEGCSNSIAENKGHSNNCDIALIK